MNATYSRLGWTSALLLAALPHFGLLAGDSDVPPPPPNGPPPNQGPLVEVTLVQGNQGPLVGFLQEFKNGQLSLKRPGPGDLTLTVPAAQIASVAMRGENPPGGPNGPGNDLFGPNDRPDKNLPPNGPPPNGPNDPNRPHPRLPRLNGGPGGPGSGPGPTEGLLDLADAERAKAVLAGILLPQIEKKLTSTEAARLAELARRPADDLKPSERDELSKLRQKLGLPSFDDYGRLRKEGGYAQEKGLLEENVQRARQRLNETEGENIDRSAVLLVYYSAAVRGELNMNTARSLETGMRPAEMEIRRHRMSQLVAWVVDFAVVNNELVKKYDKKQPR